MNAFKFHKQDEQAHEFVVLHADVLSSNRHSQRCLQLGGLPT